MRTEMCTTCKVFHATRQPSSAATKRFCHKCGAQVGGTHTSGWRAGLPWGVAGAALGALLTVLALRLGAGSTEPGAGDAPEATAPRSQLPAPDISQMSPEERATRLYNRVMMLHTQGKADSAAFFLPMALQAYTMLPALDVDARYHIGVLDLTGGNAAAALAQADAIRRTVPTHLFGYMLRARRYVHELGDIESLNRRALAGELEVTAVSLHAYAYLADRYALLAHGASVGDRYGPRIVARGPRPADPQAALGGESLLVAVPGELTTAFLALKLYQPAARHVVVPFDQIEEYVAAGRAEAGLLIHEGQLTYADRGLHLWVDLGEWWHDETGLPLPLGGNVVRRDLGEALMRDIARDLKASIQYGLAHRAEALAHATTYGRGLDASCIDRFVGMYVNTYTVDYGPTGRQAVSELLARAHGAGLLPERVDVTFVAG